MNGRDGRITETESERFPLLAINAALAKNANEQTPADILRMWDSEFADCDRGRPCTDDRHRIREARNPKCADRRSTLSV
jgi:hypothetical protein